MDISVLSRRNLILASLAFLAGTYFLADVWLPWVARSLMRVDPLEPAEVIVVLAGDTYGNRVVRASELANQGYGSTVLVSGGPVFYGARECDAAIEFAVERGARRELFEPFCTDASSTLEEAIDIDAELRRRGVRRALVVTSDFHTRRSSYIFRTKTSGEIEYRLSASTTHDFDPEAWWKTRSGKKIVLLEFLKSINSYWESPE